jgi:eukaryotic-like serine/threonine-protein kinase
MSDSDACAVRNELAKILASPLFAGSPRMSRFLRFVVEETLEGRADKIKEYVIAIEVFDKPHDYDSYADSTVRTEAGKLRGRLSRYYETHGRSDPLVIDIPKGTYSPVFLPGPPGPPPAAAAPSRKLPSGWKTLLWAMAAVLTAAALLLYVAEERGPANDRPVLRFQIHPPPGVRVASLRNEGPAVISPDGRHLAFVGRSEAGRTEIWIRPLDSLAARALPGTEGAAYPFWSPDSRQLAFFSDRKLKKVSLDRSGAVILCEAPLGRGGAWSRRGTIVFSPAPEAALQSVADSGGVPRPVTAPASDAGERLQLHPWFLPGSDRFLYLGLASTTAAAKLLVARFDGRGEQVPVAAAGDAESNIVFARPPGGEAPGYLFYVRSSALVAHPFDPARLTTLGDPATIAEGVRTGFERRHGDFSVSDTGILVYRSAAAVSNELAWLDRSGALLETVPGGASDRDVALSPDNRKVAVVRIRSVLEGADIWLRDLDRGPETRITFDAATDYTPVWSRHGRTLYYSSHQADGFVLFRTPVFERREPERLHARKEFMAINDCSPGSEALMFQVRTTQGHYDLWSIEPETAQAKPLLATGFNEVQGQFSPDGQWFAYSSDESGRFEVYLRSRAGAVAGTTLQVSSQGGLQPRWRRDGRDLFYLGLDGRLLAVSVLPGPTPRIGTPRALFLMQIDPLNPDATQFFSYAVSSDGRRFLLSAGDPADSSAPWTVITNWPAAIAGQRAAVEGGH